MKSHLEQLYDTLRATPGAEERLLVRFKQINWVDMNENATAQELIENALNRIKYDATKYSVFIDTLRKMAGVDQVVSSIEGNLKVNLFCMIIMLSTYLL